VRWIDRGPSDARRSSVWFDRAGCSGDDSNQLCQLRRADHDTGADGGPRIAGSSARSGLCRSPRDGAGERAISAGNFRTPPRNHTGIVCDRGLVAATTTYWILGRRLSGETNQISKFEAEAVQGPTVLNIINVSGREAIQIVVNIIPMLLLSLVIVFALQGAGVIDAFVALLAPMLSRFGIDHALVLLAVTKYLAGSTALVGVIEEASKQAPIAASSLNSSAGFLLNPLDLPGVAIFLSASKRLGRVCAPATGGACVGIALRTVATVMAV